MGRATTGPQQGSTPAAATAVGRGEGNAILDAVALMVTDVLRRRGFALLAPVVASFRTAENGSTGVEVEVRVGDPSHANAAKAALGERFPDPLSQVVVS